MIRFLSSLSATIWIGLDLVFMLRIQGVAGLSPFKP